MSRVSVLLVLVSEALNQLKYFEVISLCDITKERILTSIVA